MVSDIVVASAALQKGAEYCLNFLNFFRKLPLILIPVFISHSAYSAHFLLGVIPGYLDLPAALLFTCQVW